MPIINLQKRSRELGRIRLGQKGDRGQPQKLEKFRFTSNSRPLLEKIATLYGGEVREWANGTQRFELHSNADRVPIMVPPQPVTQWHEVWRKSGCVHRCDGERNVLTDELCDPQDPLHLEAIDKPTTRLNVVLRDVEGVGVWRTESKGWHAATELPDVAEFLAQAGGYVDGWLALDYREDHGVKDGKPYTHKYLVPIIEIDVTPAQLMAGHGRVAAPALTGGPVGGRPALAAAGPDYVALAADATTVEEISGIWHQANAAGHLTQGLIEHFKRRAAEIAPETAAPAADQVPDAEGVVDAEVVDDPPATASTAQSGGDADAIWQDILRVGGRHGMTLADVNVDFAQVMGGLMASDATAGELQVYLDKLRAADGEQVPA